MKRGLSDSDSDGDDLLEDSLTAGSPSQSCQISDRKRRRGVIEKRRRDRINSSLSELRRLVPSAFEKQGSAKLEKAEILQMTVDHLKLLQHKGLNSYSCDPSSLAKDYRHMGFTECATEVARYLVAVEGLDLQDPLRMRLLTHLHSFANREGAAVKAAAFQHSSSVWSSPTPSLHPQYNPIMPSAHPGTGSFSSGQAAFGSLRSGQAGSGSLGSGAFGAGTLPPQSSAAEVMNSTSASSLMTAFSDLRGCVGSGDAGSGAGCGAGMGGVPTLQGSAGMVPTSSGRSAPTSSLSPPLLHSLGQLHSHTPTSPFPGAGQSLGVPPSSHHPSYPQPHSTTMQMPGLGVGLQQVSSVKPYRPWGGELAY